MISSDKPNLEVNDNFFDVYKASSQEGKNKNKRDVEMFCWILIHHTPSWPLSVEIICYNDKAENNYASRSDLNWAHDKDDCFAKPTQSGISEPMVEDVIALIRQRESEVIRQRCEGWKVQISGDIGTKIQDR